MEELNAKARDAILAQNRIGRDTETEVDLHGLHAGEALALVKGCIEDHASKRRAWQGRGLFPSKLVKVITGKGLHSQSGPRLRPAIENSLQLQRIEYKVARDGGSLTIMLQ